MLYKLILILVGACILVSDLVIAQQVEFSYDGRVRSGGVPFDGNGLFKFAVVSSDGTICYWSNDGVTLSGDEPTSSIQIAVSAGFFSVIMGDDSLANMAPLDASIFNTDERVLLRVWFSDGVNGFQKLSPDRPITNPALIGLQDQKPLTLYVNPLIGNDQFAGNRPSKPKKTIQSAWNALPRLLSTTATIQLADGEYYEALLLQGKIIPGDCRIVLRGNSESSSSVCILGSSDRLTSTTPVRPDIITVIEQRCLRFEDITFAYATSACLAIAENSRVELDSCQLREAKFGLNTAGFSDVYIEDSIISDSPSGPFMFMGVFNAESKLSAVNCKFVHVQAKTVNELNSCGLATATHSQLLLKDCEIVGFYSGVDAIYMGFATFNGGGNLIRNCNYGARIMVNSVSQGAIASAGKVTYQNNTTDVSIDASSINGG
jgi:hypothetical protein